LITLFSEVTRVSVFSKTSSTTVSPRSEQFLGPISSLVWPGNT
jgi:hypothetical protein